MKEQAPGKFNPLLVLGPVRADGRHELVSVLQAITRGDGVVLESAGDPEDRVVCPGVRGPNLALDAVRAFRAATGWDGPPVRVSIKKHLPVAGGMAGGSSDAAATLRLVARHAGIAREDIDLLGIAATVGSDVPALIAPGRVLCTGAGEVVEPLAPASPVAGVLAILDREPLRTPDVFREADRLGLPRAAAALHASEALARAGEAPVANDLEPAALSLRPRLADALALARELGAREALVSGSGPTVVGLFDDPPAARAAAEELEGRRPAFWAETLP